jgi:hypothetical protein
VFDGPGIEDAGQMCLDASGCVWPQIDRRRYTSRRRGKTQATAISRCHALPWASYEPARYSSSHHSYLASSTHDNPYICSTQHTLLARTHALRLVTHSARSLHTRGTSAPGIGSSGPRRGSRKCQPRTRDITLKITMCQVPNMGFEGGKSLPARRTIFSLP